MVSSRKSRSSTFSLLVIPEILFCDGQGGFGRHLNTPLKRRPGVWSDEKKETSEEGGGR